MNIMQLKRKRDKLIRQYNDIRIRLTVINNQIEEITAREEKERIKERIENWLKKDLDIAEKVLRHRLKIKDVADIYGITGNRIRQRLHRFCKRANGPLYESLYHTNRYEGGWVNDKCLPLLGQLRDHADEFLNRHPIDTNTT